MTRAVSFSENTARQILAVVDTEGKRAVRGTMPGPQVAIAIARMTSAINGRSGVDGPLTSGTAQLYRRDSTTNNLVAIGDPVTVWNLGVGSAGNVANNAWVMLIREDLGNDYLVNWEQCIQ